MKSLKYKTTFPDLMGNRFQLLNFSLISNSPPHEMPKDRSIISQEINSVLNSIGEAQESIGSAKWQSIGFASLETLARSINCAILLDDEIEAYHQLAWLRSWMFWIDLRQTDDSKEEHMLDDFSMLFCLLLCPSFLQGIRDIWQKSVEV
jgi:hypothetical protein